MKIKFRYVLLFLFVTIGLLTISDKIRIDGYEKYPSQPSKERSSDVYKIYFELTNGASEIDWDRLNGTLDFINKENDCADFRLASLVRILYDFPDQIPNSVLKKIESVLFNFRYWMDEPGGNGMCYWSENHQVLFASSEYLIGQSYPDSIFHNSGLSGKQHMQKAKILILDWLEMRWKYGFSEFYSNVYYSEDIGGMINLIDYCADDSIALKTSIIMDLLIYDVASQKSGNMFLSVNGRAYEKGRKGDPGASFYNITNHLWDSGNSIKPHLNYGFIARKKYTVPPVLIEIGNDKRSVAIKQSNGLNISELKDEGYFGSDNRSIMMQWGMEAFTNHEIIRNSLNYIRDQNLFSNEFLHGFKEMDYTAFRLLHLEGILAYFLNMQTDGLAIQRANTYTYRTNDYSIYTVQNHFPGTNAIQHHVTGMNLGSSFAVFHVHPAIPESRKLHSPNYWVGYGRMPHAVQDENVSLAIYNLPDEKNLMEMDMLHFTHAYFPTQLFDSTLIKKNYAFGKKGSAYCALIGKNDLNLKNQKTDDLIQNGQKTFWIIEAGSAEEDGSFKDFCDRILKNKVRFNDEILTLEYTSGNKDYALKYDDKFSVDALEIDTEYDRFDSPYIKAKRKTSKMEFNFNNKFLLLDFENLVRKYN
ncbi:MAG: hypothetical protein DWQ10_09375 [Calditrichaeota bacterium]|nr:MAG: hypothetical protein DWQ10_09375 [Calditrichota bacterium]